MTETVIPRPINYAALKTEIALPAYAGMTDPQIIAAVNAKTIAPPGGAKLLAAPGTILAAFDATEYQALTAIQLSQLQPLWTQDSIDASAGSFVRNLLLAIFPTATKPLTRAKLNTLVTNADSATVSWVQATLGVPAIVQADLDNARAA